MAWILIDDDGSSERTNIMGGGKRLVYVGEPLKVVKYPWGAPWWRRVLWKFYHWRMGIR